MKLVDFDLAELLDSEEAISEYLTQVLTDGDSDEPAARHWLHCQGTRHGTDCQQRRAGPRKPVQGTHPRCQATL